jgi:ABC-type transport system involved in multi-copper enzyme maturation permease subunit
LLHISLFAGFKGAALFRSEIEDSSILVMISKPINKFRFNLVRWLVFMTAMFIFVFLLSLFMSFGMMLGSNFIELTARDIFLALAITTCLGMVVALIFSSIALILSTFLSSSLTIGLTALVGLISPITGIIQNLVTPDTQATVGKRMEKLLGMNNSFYEQLSNPEIDSFDQIQEKDIYISNAEISTIYYLRNKKYNVLLPSSGVSLTNRIKITDVISKKYFDNIINETNPEKRKEKVNNFKKTTPFHKLKNVSNPYSYLKYFDISYHFQLLSSIISDVSVSDEQMNKFSSIFSAASGSNSSGNLGPVKKDRIVDTSSVFMFSESFINSENKVSSILQSGLVENQKDVTFQLIFLTAIADFISQKEEETGTKISKEQYNLSQIESLKKLVETNYDEFASSFPGMSQNSLENLLKSKDVYDYYEFLGGESFSSIREKLIRDNASFATSLELVLANDPEADTLYTNYTLTDFLNKY